METESVSELIRQVKNGRKECYLPLVEQFEARVRGFIAGRCPDRHLVDDLVQHVFIHAYQHLDEFEEETNFVAWLLTISRFSVLGEFKALAKRAKAHQRYTEYVLASRAVDTIESGGIQEAREKALTRCFEGLEEKSREILDLRYKAGMTIQEICDRLGKTLSWGKSFLARLKASLRECIEKKLTAEA